MNMKLKSCENYEIQTGNSWNHEFENEDVWKSVSVYEMCEYEIDIFPWYLKPNMKQSNITMDRGCLIYD